MCDITYYLLSAVRIFSKFDSLIFPQNFSQVSKNINHQKNICILNSPNFIL